MKPVILLVDDEPAITRSLKRSLQKEPFEILTANSPKQAMQILDQTRADVLVCDEQMPGMSGSPLLALVRQRYPDSIRIILTGQATLETAIKAINQGEVYRFLIKPCQPYELIQIIKQGLRHQRLLRQTQQLLHRYRRQKTLLSRLGELYPGLCKDQKLEPEVIIEESNLDFDQVLAQVEEELGRKPSLDD